MTLPMSVSPASKPPLGWKKLFLRGLILLLPTIITLIVLLWGFGLINDYLVSHVSDGVNAVVDAAGFDKVDGGRVKSDGSRPMKVSHPWAVDWFVVTPLSWFLRKALGFLLTLTFIGLVGVMVGTLIGKRIWNWFESRMTQVPLVRYVYPFIREVTDVVFTENKAAFSSVVVVEFPRKGIWALGFVTGNGFDTLHQAIGKRVVAVFLPASPTPMTGYIAFVPEDEVVRLDMSVDDAFRRIMSGGVVVPGMKTPSSLAGVVQNPPPAPSPKG